VATCSSWMWAAIPCGIWCSAAHRRGDRRLGAGILLRTFFVTTTRDFGAVGPIVGRSWRSELRLLDRQRPAGRSAVERRDQLRWVIAFIFATADPADPQHLPEVLRREDGFGAVGYLLRPPWSAPATSSNSSSGSPAFIPPSARRRSWTKHLLELHHLAQQSPPHPRRRARPTVIRTGGLSMLRM